MAEKDDKKEKKDKKDEPWRYKHVSGGEHPDNNPPVTAVAEASEEAAEAETKLQDMVQEKLQRPDWEKLPGGKPPEKADKEEADEEEDLEAMTVVELKELATTRNIYTPSQATKAEIIKAIEKG